MAEIDSRYDALIAQFHAVGDTFPGPARLIDKDHFLLAANPVAERAGFTAGAFCARVGAPEIHRGCKLKKMFDTGEAQTDRVLPDRVRGWIPVKGYPELCIHFAVLIPEE